MFAFLILILVDLLFFIKWLIQSTSLGLLEGEGKNRAFEILKKQFARGEINMAEYEEKKKVLA